MMMNLFGEIAKNAIFVLEFLAVVVVIFVAARMVEKWEKKKTGNTERILSTRKLTMVGMFSAIAAILMIFEFPLPFAPAFYKLDFSEIPFLITAFAFLYPSLTQSPKQSYSCNNFPSKEYLPTGLNSLLYGIFGKLLTLAYCFGLHFFMYSTFSYDN